MAERGHSDWRPQGRQRYCRQLVRQVCFLPSCLGRRCSVPSCSPSSPANLGRDFDPNGPCGPTAFWKISDHKSQSNDLQVLRDDFLSIVDGGDDDELEHLDDELDDIDGELYFPEELVIIPVPISRITKMETTKRWTTSSQTSK